MYFFARCPEMQNLASSDKGKHECASPTTSPLSGLFARALSLALRQCTRSLWPFAPLHLTITPIVLALYYSRLPMHQHPAPGGWLLESASRQSPPLLLLISQEKMLQLTHFHSAAYSLIAFSMSARYFLAFGHVFLDHDIATPYSLPLLA